MVAILATVLGHALPVGTAAQEPVVEQQVALDEAGRLLRVDAELARRLGVFGDLSDVREILLFRGPDGYVLEVTRRRGGILVRERTRLTEAQVLALRAEVSARLAERSPAALLDRSGRLLLLGTTTAAGLGFYGWAVPSVLDVEDTRGRVALYMLVASASFFGPWAWSAGQTVTSGMANAAFWGASRGIVHGIALHRVLAGPPPGFVQCAPDDFACFDRIDERREDWLRGRTAVALGGSVAEAIGGLVWARAARATAGDAHLLGTASDFGALGAVGLGVVAGLDGDGDEAALWGLSLAGAGLGLGGGAVLRARRDHSWGDTEVFRAAGLLGAYTGVAAAHGFDLADRGTAAAALAGGALGLAAGDRMVRSREITTVQGLLVDLGTVAGGLLGLGTAVLIADDESTDGTIHFVLSAVGGWAGFGLTFRSLSGEEEGREGTGSPGAGGAGPLRLDLATLPAVGRGGSASLPPLGLRLRYTF